MIDNDIRTALKEHISILELTLEDLSADHEGHREAREHGGGHYRLTVVSPDFRGVPILDRQRLINRALRGFFGSRIHALSITAKAPDETRDG